MILEKLLVRIKNETNFPTIFIKFSFFIDENTEFFVKLKILTEETYQQNNNTPVVFIVHSMGGCMTLKFLRAQTQEWKDKYVRAMVSLAGAWGGAVKALKVFTVGTLKEINRKQENSILTFHVYSKYVFIYLQVMT